MACMRLPRSSSGRPTTRTTRTPGYASIAASTSAGIDVRAAGQDHVAAPVAEVEVAVGVHPAHVAEALPTVAVRASAPM